MYTAHPFDKPAKRKFSLFERWLKFSWKNFNPAIQIKSYLREVKQEKGGRRQDKGSVEGRGGRTKAVEGGAERGRKSFNKIV